MAEGGCLSPRQFADCCYKSDCPLRQCDRCSERGKSVEAYGYCSDCDDYLCEHCFDQHLIPKPMRSHVLQELSAMNRGKAEIQNGHSDGPFLACSVHADKRASCYSKSKDKHYCDTCFSVLKDWNVRGDLVPIQKLVEASRDSEEFKAFTEKLKKSHIQCRNKKEHATRILELTDDHYEKLYQKVSNDLTQVKGKAIRKCINVIEKCDSAAEVLEELINEQTEYRNDSNSLYALMHLNSKQLDQVVSDVEAIEVERNPSFPQIREADIKKCISSLMSGFSGLNVVDAGTQTISPGTLLKKIKLPDCSPVPACKLFKNISWLGMNRVLIAEHFRNTLTLLDVENVSITDQLTLDGGIYEMALSDNNTVYVAMPKKEKIICVRATDTDLSEFGEIATDGQCFTLACLDNKLRYQYHNPCALIETDLNGYRRRTIREDFSELRDGSGKPLVTNPVHSVADKATGSMYISCYMRNTVLEITSNGQVGRLIHTEKLNGPRGMIIDTDGSILFCSERGKSVLRLTHTNEILDDVLSGSLDFYPLSLALDESNRTLYVAGKSEYIHVYQI